MEKEKWQWKTNVTINEKDEKPIARMIIGGKRCKRKNKKQKPREHHLISNEKTMPWAKGSKKLRMNVETRRNKSLKWA